jgi:hypothetical protein
LRSHNTGMSGRAGAAFTRCAYESQLLRLGVLLARPGKNSHYLRAVGGVVRSLVERGVRFARTGSSPGGGRASLAYR